MKLKLKKEYVDTYMSCPFTGKVINLTFLEREMYIHYYYKGYKNLFIVEGEKTDLFSHKKKDK